MQATLQLPADAQVGRTACTQHCTRDVFAVLKASCRSQRDKLAMEHDIWAVGQLSSCAYCVETIAFPRLWGLEAAVDHSLLAALFLRGSLMAR